VETWEEAFFLRAAGVDCGQGWFWSKAVSGPEASRMLEKGYRRLQDRRSRPKKR
jgi:sensor c-di-GMP phosphodiesterase-like protein